jgi:hypothetical protein
VELLCNSELPFISTYLFFFTIKGSIFLFVNIYQFLKRDGAITTDPLTSYDTNLQKMVFSLLDTARLGQPAVNGSINSFTIVVKKLPYNNLGNINAFGTKISFPSDTLLG